MELHGGEFPCTPDEVFALPGVGRYTGGAILSIACQQPLPILEGNTVRVFSRLAALQEDVKSKAGVETLWSIAAAVVPAEQPGVFNQAAMELGALICKPTNPACEVCPVSSQCQAYKLGLQGEIPGRVTRIQYESRARVRAADPRPAQTLAGLPGAGRPAVGGLVGFSSDHCRGDQLGTG